MQRECNVNTTWMQRECSVNEVLMYYECSANAMRMQCEWNVSEMWVKCEWNVSVFVVEECMTMETLVICKTLSKLAVKNVLVSLQNMIVKISVWQGNKKITPVRQLKMAGHLSNSSFPSHSLIISRGTSLRYAVSRVWCCAIC